MSGRLCSCLQSFVARPALQSLISLLANSVVDLTGYSSERRRRLVNRDFQNPVRATSRELPRRSDRCGDARTNRYQLFPRALAWKETTKRETRFNSRALLALQLIAQSESGTDGN